MHSHISHMLTAAGTALSAVGIAIASVSCGGTTTTAPQPSRPSAPAGAQLWVQRYNGPGNGDDGGLFGGVFPQPVSAAVSPGGGTVFVTGGSRGAGTGSDYATVAYNAATGARLWASRYNGPGNGDDIAYSVAVSPGGGTVFVTGDSKGAGTGSDYATVAYNAATGAQLWASRYNGPANGLDVAASVTVSPSGSTVFVTGTSQRAGTGSDYATVAYNAATGAQLWASRYHGPGNGDVSASSMAISPSGGTVFVTGYSAEADYATVAYNAATGAQLWASRYNGPANGVDEAKSVAVSPDGSKVFVTGNSNPANSREDVATVAYNAATGAQLWASRYNGPANKVDVGFSVAVNPAGDKVFVTGMSGRAGGRQPSAAEPNPPMESDYATVAYNTATGAQLWASRYHGQVSGGNAGGFLDNVAFAVAVSPSGGTVFVTGMSRGTGGSDYATVAYNAATGAQLWASRYNGPGNGGDFATSVTVSRGGTVFVTGTSKGAGTGFDYATIAYRG